MAGPQRDVEVKVKVNAAELSKLQAAVGKAGASITRVGKASAVTGAQTSTMSKAFGEAKLRAEAMAGSMGPLGAVVGKMGPAGLAAAVGVVALGKAFLGAVQTSKEFNSAISDLSALTGAVGNDLQFFRRAAAELGSTTSLTAVQAAQAFKRIASAKPELLENAAALATVTKEAVILAEATGLTLPDAARALTGALNQFQVGAEAAGRFINVLAAGAKFGAAEIPDLSVAVVKAGTVAAQAGVSFELFNATLQRLAAFGAPAAEFGTGMRNVLLTLQKGADDTNPAIHGLTQALLNLGDKGLSTSEQVELFGKRNVVVAKQMIATARSAELLATRVTGTSIAYEQAEIRTDNLEFDTIRLKSAYEGLQIAIAENDGPLRLFVQGITAATRAMERYVRARESANFSIFTSQGVGEELLRITGVTAGLEALRLKIDEISKTNLGAALGAEALDSVVDVFTQIDQAILGIPDNLLKLQAGAATVKDLEAAFYQLGEVVRDAELAENWQRAETAGRLLAVVEAELLETQAEFIAAAGEEARLRGVIAIAAFEEGTGVQFSSKAKEDAAKEIDELLPVLAAEVKAKQEAALANKNLAQAELVVLEAKLRAQGVDEEKIQFVLQLKEDLAALNTVLGARTKAEQDAAKGTRGATDAIRDQLAALQLEVEAGERSLRLKQDEAAAELELEQARRKAAGATAAQLKQFADLESRLQAVTDAREDLTDAEEAAAQAKEARGDLEEELKLLELEEDLLADVTAGTRELADAELDLAEARALAAGDAQNADLIRRIEQLRAANAETRKRIEETAQAAEDASFNIGEAITNIFDEVIVGIARGTNEGKSAFELLKQSGEALWATMLSNMIQDKLSFDAQISKNFLEDIPGIINQGLGLVGGLLSGAGGALGGSAEGTGTGFLGTIGNTLSGIGAFAGGAGTFGGAAFDLSNLGTVGNLIGSLGFVNSLFEGANAAGQIGGFGGRAIFAAADAGVGGGFVPLSVAQQAGAVPTTVGGAGNAGNLIGIGGVVAGLGFLASTLGAETLGNALTSVGTVATILSAGAQVLGIGGAAAGGAAAGAAAGTASGISGTVSGIVAGVTSTASLATLGIAAAIVGAYEGISAIIGAQDAGETAFTDAQREKTGRALLGDGLIALFDSVLPLGLVGQKEDNFQDKFRSGDFGDISGTEALAHVVLTGFTLGLGNVLVGVMKDVGSQGGRLREAAEQFFDINFSNTTSRNRSNERDIDAALRSRDRNAGPVTALPGVVGGPLTGPSRFANGIPRGFLRDEGVGDLTPGRPGRFATTFDTTGLGIQRTFDEQAEAFGLRRTEKLLFSGVGSAFRGLLGFEEDLAGDTDFRGLELATSLLQEMEHQGLSTAEVVARVREMLLSLGGAGGVIERLNEGFGSQNNILTVSNYRDAVTAMALTLQIDMPRGVDIARITIDELNERFTAASEEAKSFIGTLDLTGLTAQEIATTMQDLGVQGVLAWEDLAEAIRHVANTMETINPLLDQAFNRALTDLEVSDLEIRQEFFSTIQQQMFAAISTGLRDALIEGVGTSAALGPFFDQVNQAFEDFAASGEDGRLETLRAALLTSFADAKSAILELGPVLQLVIDLGRELQAAFAKSAIALGDSALATTAQDIAFAAVALATAAVQMEEAARAFNDRLEAQIAALRGQNVSQFATRRLNSLQAEGIEILDEFFIQGLFRGGANGAGTTTTVPRPFDTNLPGGVSLDTQAAALERLEVITQEFLRVRVAQIQQELAEITSVHQERIRDLQEEGDTIRDTAQAAIELRQEELGLVNEQLRVAQQWQGVVEHIDRTLLSIATGQNSPEDPLARLSLLQSEFAQQRDLFFGDGSAEDRQAAAQELTQLAPSILQLATQAGIPQSSEAFRALFGDVVGVLEAARQTAAEQTVDLESLQERANELTEEIRDIQQQMEDDLEGITTAIGAEQEAIVAAQRSAERQIMRVNENTAGVLEWIRGKGNEIFKARQEEIEARLAELGFTNIDMELIQADSLTQLRKIVRLLEEHGGTVFGGDDERAGGFGLTRGGQRALEASLPTLGGEGGAAFAVIQKLERARTFEGVEELEARDPLAGEIGDIVRTLFSGTFNNLQAFRAVLHALGEKLSNPDVVQPILGFDVGGITRRDQVAQLHAREFVLPLSRLPEFAHAFAGSGGGTGNVTVNVDMHIEGADLDNPGRLKRRMGRAMGEVMKDVLRTHQGVRAEVRTIQKGA